MSGYTQIKANGAYRCSIIEDAFVHSIFKQLLRLKKSSIFVGNSEPSAKAMKRGTSIEHPLQNQP